MTRDDNLPESTDTRTYLAAERTLLAWVRTGLAMMGFGFVVARFGLFLREIAAEQGVADERGIGASLWVGTALVLLGVAVNLLSAWNYANLLGRLDRGESPRTRSRWLGAAVAILLGVLGLFIAGYLIFGLARGN